MLVQFHHIAAAAAQSSIHDCKELSVTALHPSDPWVEIAAPAHV